MLLSKLYFRNQPINLIEKASEMKEFEDLKIYSKGFEKFKEKIETLGSEDDYLKNPSYYQGKELNDDKKSNILSDKPLKLKEGNSPYTNVGISLLKRKDGINQ